MSSFHIADVKHYQTLDMIPRDLLHSKPIDLRHICLFYLGHIPGFLDIHMSVRGDCFLVKSAEC